MKENKKDFFQSCIPEIEKTIGYTFRDKNLLTQAFTRTSFCNENGGGYQSNEVLEFIGDSVLSVSIITFLMEMHTERYAHGIKTVFGEGDFSNIKSKLSDKKNLSECITAIGLQKYLRLGEGDKKLGIENEPSVKEDLFESIIGATYIDCDRSIETVMTVVSKMLDVSAYAVKTPPTQSSKNALQEFCADKKRKLPPPIYKTLGEEGPDHKKVYERGVYIGERLVASATGKNLKIADAGAADAALKILLAEEAAKSEKEKPKFTTKSTNPTPTATEVTKTNSTRTEGAKQKKTDKKTDKSAKKQTIVDNTKTEQAPKVPKKAEEAAPSTTAMTVKNATRGGTSSASKLKAHATKAKVATPTFKDLGEAKQNGRSICRIECIFMGKSVIGEGDTRPEAKEIAATKMLDSIKPEAKKPTQVKKTKAQNGPKSTEAAKPKADENAKSNVTSKPKAEKTAKAEQVPSAGKKAKTKRRFTKKKTAKN